LRPGARALFLRIEPRTLMMTRARFYPQIVIAAAGLPTS
jgi:hypothetical protein